MKRENTTKAQMPSTALLRMKLYHAVLHAIVVRALVPTRTLITCVPRVLPRTPCTSWDSFWVAQFVDNALSKIKSAATRGGGHRYIRT